MVEYYGSSSNIETQKILDQNEKTLFVVPNRGLEWYRTREQCEEKAKKIIKDFNPKEYLAQKLFRYQFQGSDYFYAILYRDFSKNHTRDDIAEYDEDILYLGRLEMGVVQKKTDGNERSDTFKQRIDSVEQAIMPDRTIKDCPVLKEVGYYSYFPATKENCEKLAQTVGVFPKGFTTEFVFSLNNGGRNIPITTEEEFFSLTIKEAQLLDVKKQRLKEEEESQRTEKPSKNNA